MLKSHHQALLKVYADLHNLRNLIFDHCMSDDRLGCRIQCPALCEPHHHTRAVWLFPYEHLHITANSGRRFPQGTIPVPAGTQCPFFYEGGCALGDAKPMSCRMFPAFFYQDRPNYLKVYVHPYCGVLKQSVSSLLVNKHIDQWLGVVVALMPYMSQAWWASIASIPRGQCLGEAGIELTPNNLLDVEPNVPLAMCRTLFDPICSLGCEDGVLYVNGEGVACPCVQSKIKALNYNVE